MLTIAGVTVLLMGLMVLRRRRGVLHSGPLVQVAMLCVLYCICACSTKMGEAGVSVLLKEKIIKPDTRGWSFVMYSFCQTSTSPTLPVQPKRGKVVVVVVLLLLLLGTVRYESKYRPIIHFRCFTDPHKIQIPKAHDTYYPMTPPWWQWQRHTQIQRQRQRQNFKEESLPVYISLLTKCCNRYI